MKYAIYALDKPNHTDVRQQTRPNHLSHIESYANGDNGITILTAGALRAEDDPDIMIGSLIIVEAETKSQVQDFIKNDPYTKADLFESVKINPIGVLPMGWNQS